MFKKKNYDIDFQHGQVSPNQIAGQPTGVEINNVTHQVQSQMEYPFRFVDTVHVNTKNGIVKEARYTTKGVIKRLERDRLGQWELILLDKNNKTFSLGRIIFELDHGSKNLHIIEVIGHL